MTTFLDGPGKGTTLMLRRAPMFLRVVVNGKGIVDALDQPDDISHAAEMVFAYEMVGEPMTMHVRRTGGGGFYAGGEYKLCSPQPTEGELRSTQLWIRWVNMVARQRGLVK